MKATLPFLKKKKRESLDPYFPPFLKEKKNLTRKKVEIVDQFGFLCSYQNVGDLLLLRYQNLGEKSETKDLPLENSPKLHCYEIDFPWVVALYTNGDLMVYHFGYERKEMYPEWLSESQLKDVSQIFQNMLRGEILFVGPKKIQVASVKRPPFASKPEIFQEIQFLEPRPQLNFLFCKESRVLVSASAFDFTMRQLPSSKTSQITDTILLSESATNNHLSFLKTDLSSRCFVTVTQEFVRIYSVPSGKLMAKISPEKDCIPTCVSVDAEYVLIGYSDGAILVYHAVTGAFSHALNVPFSKDPLLQKKPVEDVLGERAKIVGVELQHRVSLIKRISSIVFAVDAKTKLFQYNISKNAQSKKPLLELDPKFSIIDIGINKSLLFILMDSGSEFFVSRFSPEPTIEYKFDLWENVSVPALFTGHIIHSISDLFPPTVASCYYEDKDVLFLAHSTGLITAWSVVTVHLLEQIPKLTGAVIIDLRMLNRTLVVQTSEGLELFDWDSHKWQTPIKQTDIASFELDKNGKIYFGLKNGNIVVWNLKPFQQENQWTAHADSVTQLIIFQEQTLLSGSLDGTVKAFQLNGTLMSGFVGPNKGPVNHFSLIYEDFLDNLFVLRSDCTWEVFHLIPSAFGSCLRSGDLNPLSGSLELPIARQEMIGVAMCKKDPLDNSIVYPLSFKGKMLKTNGMLLGHTAEVTACAIIIDEGEEYVWTTGKDLTLRKWQVSNLSLLQSVYLGRIASKIMPFKEGHLWMFCDDGSIVRYKWKTMTTPVPLKRETSSAAIPSKYLNSSLPSLPSTPPANQSKRNSLPEKDQSLPPPLNSSGELSKSPSSPIISPSPINPRLNETSSPKLNETSSPVTPKLNLPSRPAPLLKRASLPEPPVTPPPSESPVTPPPSESPKPSHPETIEPQKTEISPSTSPLNSQNGLSGENKEKEPPLSPSTKRLSIAPPLPTSSKPAIPILKRTASTKEDVPEKN